MQTGSNVKVLYPFNETYSEIYTVSDIQVYSTGTVYILEGIGGFDEKYLEEVL